MSRRDILGLTRRQALRLAAATSAVAMAMPANAAGAAGDQAFIDEAFRMRDAAIAAGDQPYGAVVALDGAIVGLGPSRVVTDKCLRVLVLRAVTGVGVEDQLRIREMLLQEERVRRK